MGVWPPGAGPQGQAPNHPMPLCPQGVVVFRRHEPITGLGVERGNLSWGVVDEVFRRAAGKVSNGRNHEGKSQYPVCICMMRLLRADTTCGEDPSGLLQG